MQWKSIKWNDCQEYAILPQFWSSRKTTWLIFDPNAVLSSIDVLEKGGFVHFIFTVLLSLDACPSILRLHWHQLAISCLQFHVLFPLQLSPASHSPPAMTKKAQTLPVGQLNPICNSAVPGRKISKSTLQYPVVKAPQKNCWACSDPRNTQQEHGIINVWDHGDADMETTHSRSFAPFSPCSCSPILKSSGNTGAGDSRPGHNASAHWMSGFIWPTACQQTDPCFPKGLPNFALQTENDHLWTWMTGLSNLFSHHINPEATQLQGVLCQDTLHHPAQNFSIIVKTQRSNSAGLRNK